MSNFRMHGNPLIEKPIVSSAIITKRPAFTPTELTQLSALDLPDTDGQPMDSDWHRIVTSLLVEVVRYHIRRKRTGYCGGNMCLYYSLTQARNLDFLGPDFFYVKDAADPQKERKKWEVWEENNLFPDVIIELLSPSTKAKDFGTKKKIYEQTFQTAEYFVYDPDEEKLLGWRLSPVTNLYEPLDVDEDGRLFSEELNLGIGTWQGTIESRKRTWLRFFHADGELVLRQGEAETLAERRKKNDALELLASERAAKEAAQAEVERLRQLLESQ